MARSPDDPKKAADQKQDADVRPSRTGRRSTREALDAEQEPKAGRGKKAKESLSLAEPAEEKLSVGQKLGITMEDVKKQQRQKIGHGVK